MVLSFGYSFILSLVPMDVEVISILSGDNSQWKKQPPTPIIEILDLSIIVLDMFSVFTLYLSPCFLCLSLAWKVVDC